VTSAVSIRIIANAASISDFDLFPSIPGWLSENTSALIMLIVSSVFAGIVGVLFKTGTKNEKDAQTAQEPKCSSILVDIQSSNSGGKVKVMTMQTKINDDLASIVDTIKGMMPKARIYLFGSHADGTAHIGSDIDLCIVLPTIDKNRFEIMDDIREAVYDKTMFPIDLLVFSVSEFEKDAGTKSRVQYEVAHKGVLLHG
jgi:predicted nucleotidyltransferase